MSETNYFDRELSWLEFNQRVLNEALNEDVPLLERLKFLAITSSNLDEFFRVRVGALTRLIESDAAKKAPSGLTPTEQMAAVQARIKRMVDDQYKCLANEIAPKLIEHDIRQLSEDELNSTQKMMLNQVFETEILSVLTPMSVGEGVQFPLLANQILNLCIRLAPHAGEAESETETDRFAVIPFGRTLSRFYSLPSETGFAYMTLEDIVSMFIHEFFPGEEVLECCPFRLTRNAEVEVEELTPQGLAVNMAEVIVARTEADCLRLEVNDIASDQLVAFLKFEVKVTDQQVHRLPGPVDLGAYMELAGRRGFENLKYEAWPPVRSPEVPAEELMFDSITEKDILLFHPYESFEPVLRLVEEAADDPDVIAIKQTLYRISRDSRIVRALKRAVDNGKHVTVLLELKARFDEERNLKQARELEAIGAQVIHGVKGLKTHAKVCIVVRREPGGVQRYVHFGTGNYNESTAKLYSDASLLTCDEELGADAIAFFNSIAGDSQPPQNYRQLESAPLRLRSKLIALIQQEIKRAKAGQEAKIMVKVNALTDTALIDTLYTASQAGVKIFLNIRGICCLKPGVPGLSENIRVSSIVDRFLEHARVIYVHHGGDPQVYISSADWMPRNLDQRKELLVPITDSKCRRQLIHILDSFRKDTTNSSYLHPDGTYSKKVLADGEEPFRAQESLYEEARIATNKIAKKQRTMFEPHHF